MKFTPNRQIHLDFHTCGLIPDVAGKFDAKQFADTLKEANVGCVCLFARCHHGYCYYPTKTGTMHPNLQVEDLLDRQIKALKDNCIATAVYTTICWDELSCDEHPEWVCVTEDNKIMKADPLTGVNGGLFEPGWRFLCWNSPYREYFKAHLEEILGRYQTDFLFLDILVNAGPCMCRYCLDRMKAHGLDANDLAARRKNSTDSVREFMDYISGTIRKINSEIGIFYNCRLRITGDVEQGVIPELAYQSLICIESLPSGPWGYDHFPIYARYFQNFASGDMPILGHTGKFQKMWGDFGGLKNQAALDYETIRMMAYGVAAVVGDQLHPDGMLDKATYMLIGNTFAKVKPFEHLLIGSKPIDEIGVLLTNRSANPQCLTMGLETETGVMKMLSQLHCQFSFIDFNSDLSKYKLLVLPDFVFIDDNFKTKLKKYLDNGGKLILSYRSGTNNDGQFNIDGLKITSNGLLEYKPHYFYPVGQCLAENVIEDTDHVQYLDALDVCADDKWQALCNITLPYFNRRWDHFCSHLQTPPEKRTSKPEMLFNGDNIVYFSSNIFECYNQHSPKVLKQLVGHAIETLIGKTMIMSNLPTTAEVTVRDNEGKTVLTIMHYVPLRRGLNVDIVEDVLELNNVKLSIDCGKRVSKITNCNTAEPIKFDVRDGRIDFVIDSVKGFCVITLEG